VALVIDTGPLVASLDRSDDWHAGCVDLLAGTVEWRIIPAPVLPEVDYLCRASGGHRSFLGLLQDIRAGAYVVEHLLVEDYERVAELLETYRDLQVGFVDASVLAIVERLRETKLATLDQRHFGAMRPRHLAALELLPG